MTTTSNTSILPSLANTSQEELLRLITERIREAVDPEKIILFGSRGRGDSRVNSDFDLLVIAESNAPRHRRAAGIYQSLWEIMEPIDVVVYTPAEVEEWREVRQAFVTAAIREGRIIYER